MKTQRKLLTDQQKAEICKKYYVMFGGCHPSCPLSFKEHSCSQVTMLQKEIQQYWNDEVEI